jgi:hypothetical protein
MYVWMSGADYKGLFEITYFWVYAKQLMQINKLLCIIHKLVKIVYKKTAFEDIIFASETENLWISIKVSLFA